MPQVPRVGEEQVEVAGGLGVFPILRPVIGRGLADAAIMDQITRTTSLADEITEEHEERLATDPEYQATWADLQRRAAAVRERRQMMGWRGWRGPIAIAAGAGIAWFARQQRWI